MIVWGGDGSRVLNTGGRYNPSSGSWTPTSTGANVPSARRAHTAFWTGTEMIVLGGGYNKGGRYNPSTDTWTATSTGVTHPEGRVLHTAVWTGAEMIIYGGEPYGQHDDGSNSSRYNPATDTWTLTGGLMSMVWHTAVWTGTEMIVWGGGYGTGVRYNPTTDIWTEMFVAPNSPPGTINHTAVWTGTEMIVWGGYDGDYDIHPGTGGRYDPTADTWSATSTGANVPDNMWWHTAVWTGAEMIVWGGSGGRYDPSSNTWMTMSSGTNLPASGHRAVWTGAEMIIWNNGGGRYNPSMDTWAALPAGPDGARGPAVWTGSEMILWSGAGADRGGGYNPSTDSWRVPSSDKNTPVGGREYHTAVWAGTQVIIWGGTPLDLSVYLYCACPSPTTSYRDADGDGYGDPATPTTTCDGTTPDGYGAESTDCDDANSAVHPGAVEVCDGLDDNCDGQPDVDKDGDGVCDAADHCPATILTPTVVIDGCDSGVRNHLFPDGCNFGDRIAACRAGARNHGQFASCVAHAVNDWRGADLITGQQGSRIVRCAAQSGH
jgi:hypothetical protein